MEPNVFHPKEAAAVVDPEFEAAVTNYIGEVISMEKKEYKPGIEPFSVHADKIRKSISESMHLFQKTYVHGYQVLMKELVVMFPKSEQEADPLAPYRPSGENMDILDNPEMFLAFLFEGGAICDILDFSPEAMKNFHDASVRLMQQKRYEDAKDALYFLVMIAPEVVVHWLALALCYAECSEFDVACQACEHAIELNRQNPDCYLILTRIYRQMQQLELARKVCDRGLQYALEHRGEEWAEKLGSVLEYAKSSIK